MTPILPGLTACLLPFGVPFLNRLSAPLTWPRGLLALVRNSEGDYIVQIQSQTDGMPGALNGPLKWICLGYPNLIQPLLDYR